MLQTITHIEKINTDNYTIDCLFEEAKKLRRVNIGRLLNQFPNTPIMQELLDVENFKQVSIDSFGALSWRNGVDFCPDVLFEQSIEID